MARGITSFNDYRKEQGPYGTRYACRYCHYFLIRQQRFHGNALAGHAKSVAAIKLHIEEKHPDKIAEGA